METVVMAPSATTGAAAVEFNFDSACTTPYMSAPSSPTRISAHFHGDATSLSSVPFNWEEKPGTPKSAAAAAVISSTTSSNYGDADQELDDADFAFDFSGQLEKSSLPADELFDGGRIKPLKPPPRFQYDQNKPLDSPKSPKSPKNFIREAFSPRKNRAAVDFDPFAAAIDQTRKENIQDNTNDKIRGREKTTTNSRINNKGSRSVSPLRVSDLLFDEEEEQQQLQQPTNNTSSFSSFWYKKWRIKDLLLFRSASESRAKDKEELKKYTMLRKPPAAAPPLEEVKNSSFRSTDSLRSVSSRRRSSGPPISAHELHYTVNRALSEEMRKRTTLPYKRGFLGCLGFHPTVTEMSKGIAAPSGSLSSRG